MKKIILRSFATAIFMIGWVAVMNAQNAANPWHLVAYEDNKEVAFYNVENITDLKTTEEGDDDEEVTIVMDNGKKFAHSIYTDFRFEPRKAGTGTANESIAVTPWTVRYVGGRLYFNEAVGGIAVYTLTGMLVAQYQGNYTEVPVNLAQGIYVVYADGKSAKLFVNNTGSGATTVQQATAQQVIESPLNPIDLRAVAGIKNYWTINSGAEMITIDIEDVDEFYFEWGGYLTIHFNNEEAVTLPDIKGTAFAEEPNPDLDRTGLICRTWICEKVTLDVQMIVDAGFAITPEEVKKAEDELNGMHKGSVWQLTKSGEATLSAGFDTFTSTWKWANKAETSIYVAGFDDPDDDDNDGIMRVIELTAKSLILHAQGDAAWFIHLIPKE